MGGIQLTIVEIACTALLLNLVSSKKASASLVEHYFEDDTRSQPPYST